MGLHFIDEPTNDLDIQTLTILEDYLETFQGIVIAVSHDRYFLDKMASRIFAFEGEGYIRQYEGNFSDYKEAKMLRDQEITEGTKANDESEERKKAASMATWKQRSSKPKFSYQEQREFETIDDDLAKLESKLSKLEEEITQAATDYTKLNELMKQKEEVEKELEKKMERWVYLNDLAEQIEAAKDNKSIIQ